MVDFIREMHFANIVYFCVINISSHFIFCDKHDTGILIARVPSLHDSYREFAGCLSYPACVRSALTSDT